MENLPLHGSRARYRRLGCRCVACSRSANAGTNGLPLSWPVRFLYPFVTLEKLADDYPPEVLAEWRANGIPDLVADVVAVRYGVHPFSVWPGYDSAGLDYGDT